MRSVLLLGVGVVGLLGAGSGCGVLHRLRRLPAPTHHVALPPAGLLGATVAVQDAEGSLHPYAAEPYPPGTLSRPMIVSPQSTITIRPPPEGLHLRVMVREVGLPVSDFTEVYTLTGARDRELVDEIRYLPPAISAPYRLPVQDLANVYNGYRLDDDDDLILIELSSGDGLVVDRYLFESRRVGWHTRLAFDVLVRTPLLPSAAAVEADIATFSPALTGGLVLGYHAEDRGGNLSLLWDRVALQASVGIGSSALNAARSEEDIEETVSRALYSALGGGGIRLLDAVSVQALVNLRAITHPEVLPVWTLGVGIDAVRLTSFAEDAGRKLLRPNTLSEATE